MDSSDRAGKAIGLGTLEDYAFLAMGLLDLYQATFDARRLIEVKEIVEKMMELFADETNGAFRETGKDDEEPLIRIKTAYDGPMPAANSTAAYVLLKLGRLTREDRFTQRGEKILKAFSSQLKEMPAMTASMAIACNFLLGPAQEIIIAGDAAKNDTNEMLRLVNSYFLPNAIILFHPAGNQGKIAEEAVPFLREYKTAGDKAAAFICENYTCREPIYDVSQLRKELETIARPPA